MIEYCRILGRIKKPMKTSQLKKQLYSESASLTKALGNPLRLEILDLLAQGPVSVEYVAGHTGLSVANTSAHLQVLRKARLVSADKDGKQVFYQLADAGMLQLLCLLRSTAARQNAEIGRLLDAYRAEKNSSNQVSFEEISQKLNSGEILLLDVRPAEEFQIARLPGAISIPVRELKARMAELPADREIITYCRGEFCLMADEAVELLRANGFRARRMEKGLPEWEQSQVAE